VFIILSSIFAVTFLFAWSIVRAGVLRDRAEAAALAERKVQGSRL
jgi:hypothetical protein